MEYHKWMIALLTLLILISGANLVIAIMDMTSEDVAIMQESDRMMGSNEMMGEDDQMIK